MTVCIAAACDNGERIVTATDGLLSRGDACGEAVIAKMIWHGPWQFMYAGIPANFDLISEEIDQVLLDNRDAFSRRHVQRTVRDAYRRVFARLSSFEALGPFDMTMDEFKESGSQVFGQAFHDEMLRKIEQKATLQGEQILVTGWGHAPCSSMIYEMGATGDSLHGAAGWATIGSGAPMAQAMLLLLGQGSHRTLAETIFNVACAKFSSEKSQGLDVGRWTTIYVAKKGESEQGQQIGYFVPQEDIAKLRAIWEAHLKPRIPDEAWSDMVDIAARASGGSCEIRDMVNHIRASIRLNREAPQGPVPTKAEQ